MPSAQNRFLSPACPSPLGNTNSLGWRPLRPWSEEENIGEAPTLAVALRIKRVSSVTTKMPLRVMFPADERATMNPARTRTASIFGG